MLKIVWVVVTNLLALGIFAGMLSTTNTSFEKVMVAGLGIIYVSIIFYGTTLVRVQLASSFQTTEQFHRLARMLNNSLEIEHEETALKTAINEVNAKNTEYYINTAFNSLIWLISMGAILVSL